MHLSAAYLISIYFNGAEGAGAIKYGATSYGAAYVTQT